MPLCVCDVGPMMKSGASSNQDAYCWHRCRHTMLHSRQCSQTSAFIERGHSSVQEYMKAEHWPAEQVVCGTILVFLCQYCSALNNRRRLEWCTSMLERLGATKRPRTALADNA